jgi:hypothetical protein
MYYHNIILVLSKTKAEKLQQIKKERMLIVKQHRWSPRAMPSLRPVGKWKIRAQVTGWAGQRFRRAYATAN